MKLNRIIFEELRDLEEGVGDKYAEKKWGIEDRGRTFSDKYSTKVRGQRPANPENGEMVAQIRYDDGELAANIFKNPKTFKNFDPEIRGVTDYNGDLYVADTDGPFFHDVFSVVDIDAYNYALNIQWHRVGSEDKLCYSISFMTQAATEDPLQLEERFEKCRRKNPTITFEEEYCGDLGQYLNERLYNDVYSEIKSLVEGVGDKYLQRSAGIPDSGEEFDAKYQQHLKSQEKGDASMGEKVAEFDSEKYVKSESGIGYIRVPGKASIYKNPTSLEGFAPKVRAISTEGGDLYMADIDGYFTHSEMSKLLFKESPYEIQKYVTWYRMNDTDEFVLASVSKVMYGELMSGKYSENFYERFWNGIAKLKENYPQFKFREVDDQLDEGVGDKYLSRTGAVPDAGEEFEKKYQKHVKRQTVDDANGKLIGTVPGDVDDPSDLDVVNVYENPKSLRNFGKGVRAVGDEFGNVYVAQSDDNFFHGNIYVVADLLNSFVIELYRVGDTDTFGTSGTFSMTNYHTNSWEVLEKEFREDKRMQEAFAALNKYNPQFTFSPYGAFDIRNGNVSEEQVDQLNAEFKNLGEGVGDKYAARVAGVADPEDEFEKKYQQHRKAQSDDHKNGTPDGEIVDKNNQVAKIYKNPTSLDNFDAEVRAVTDKDGNLYVAQFDGDFYHREITDNIRENIGDAYDVVNNITWHRVGTTDTLGLSISYINDFRYQMSGPNAPEEQAKIKMINEKHPTLTFAPFYWHDLQRNLITQDILSNTMKAFGK